MALISDGKARLARAEEKERCVLRFLRDETWSTQEILGRVIGVTSIPPIFRLLKRMEAKKFIKRGAVPLVGKNDQTIWGITDTGMMASWDDTEALGVRPRFEPGRIALSRMRHHLAVQQARVAAEAAGWTDWTRENLMGKLEANQQRPDAVVTRPDGQRVAIEVELTAKTVKRYREIVRGHLNAIRHQQWKKVYYLYPPALARLSENFLQVGAFRGKTIPVEMWMPCFVFVPLADFPQGGNQ